MRYCPPYKCPDEPWQDIGAAATQEAAIALAQTHNENPDDPCDAPQPSVADDSGAPPPGLRRETWQEWHEDICYDVTLRCDRDDDPFCCALCERHRRALRRQCFVCSLAMKSGYCFALSVTCCR